MVARLALLRKNGVYSALRGLKAVDREVLVVFPRFNLVKKMILIIKRSLFKCRRDSGGNSS
jgi:hypothetical protein